MLKSFIIMWFSISASISAVDKHVGINIVNIWCTKERAHSIYNVDSGVTMTTLNYL